MATVLNNKHREEMLDRIIANAFADRVAELTDARKKLADKLYFAFIPLEFLEIAGSRKAKAEWLCSTSTIQLYEHRNSGKAYLTVASLKPESKRDDNPIMTARRPIPQNLYDQYNHRAEFIVPEDHEIRVDIIAFNRTVDEYKTARQELHSKVFALLASVRTVEKLVEVAPDLKQFIPADALAEKPKLPAIIVSDVLADLAKAGLKLQSA